MKKIIGIFTFLSITLAAGLAYAQGMLPSPDTDLGGFFVYLYSKLNSSEWMMAFGGVLVLAVFLVRKVLVKYVDWFKTKLGGYVTSFGTALILAAGTALMAGKGLTLDLAMTALTAAFVASGGWEALRDMLNYFVGEKKTE